MGIPKYLDDVEDSCTPPLILAFSLNFVKLRQILFIAGSRHGSEDYGFSLHKSNIDNSRFVEGVAVNS